MPVSMVHGYHIGCIALFDFWMWLKTFQDVEVNKHITFCKLMVLLPAFSSLLKLSTLWLQKQATTTEYLDLKEYDKSGVHGRSCLHKAVCPV